MRRACPVVVLVPLLSIAACSGGGADRGDDPATDGMARDATRLGVGVDVENDRGGSDVGPRDGSTGDAAGQGDVSAEATFDGALWIKPGPCTFGEVGATFLGIPAYCQPISDEGYYQCDELSNRFMRDALHHPNLDNVVTEFASSICDKASAIAAYSVWGPAYGPTTGRTPSPGDLIVYAGVPGHVQVVVGFSGAAEITVVQQNAGASVAIAPWDPAASFFTDPAVECWVHAESAPRAELPDASPCSCFAGGDVCGLAIVDHEWWYGCSDSAPDGGFEYGSLYSCEGGVFTKTQECSGFCITADFVDPSGACGHLSLEE